MKSFWREFFKSPKKVIVLVLLWLVVGGALVATFLTRVNPFHFASHYDAISQADRQIVHTLAGKETFVQSFTAKNTIDGIALTIAAPEPEEAEEEDSVDPADPDEQDGIDAALEAEDLLEQDDNPLPSNWIDASLSFSLRTKDGEEVYARELKWYEIANAIQNEKLRMYFPAVDVVKGEIYELVVKTEFLEEDGVFVCFSPYDFYKEGSLTVSGEPQTGDLAFAISSPGGMYAIAVFFGATLGLLVALTVVYLLVCSGKVKMHILFLVTMLLFGIGYSAVITPGAVPDEIAHYQTAYRWSNVLTFTSPYTDHSGNALMRMEDADWSGLYEKERQQPTVNVTTYATVINNFFKMAEDETLVSMPCREVGNILQYIVPAVGITVGRLLRLGQIPTFYLARLLNLLAFSLLTVVAIRKIPFGKNVLMAVALLPIAIHQAASLSYDSIITAMAFVFIAYCLSFAYTEEQIRWSDVAILAVSGLFLSAAKAGIYIFMFGLGILVLLNRHIPLKKRLLMLSVTGVVMVVAFAVFNLLKVSDAVTGAAEGGQNYSILYVLKHPLEFIKKMVATCFVYKESYIFTTIGWPLGSLNLLSDRSYLMAAPILLTLAVLAPPAEVPHIEKESKWQKPVFFLCCVAVFLALFLAIMSWSPIGSVFITGFQGRYLLPILPLFLLLFRNRLILPKRDLAPYLIMGFVLMNALYLGDVLGYVLPPHLL